MLTEKIKTPVHKDDIKEKRKKKAEENAKKRAELEYKIRLAHKRTQNTIQLGFEKAVAHYESPSLYPLPADNNTVEKAFYDLINILPNGKRNKVIDKINETLKASPNIRKGIYKDIVNVNFKSALPIVKQVKAMTIPEELIFTTHEIIAMQEELIRKAEKPKNKGYSTSSAPLAQQAVASTKVSLFVDNITCLNPDDVLMDEVNLAGFAVDTAGNRTQLAPFFVGKFRKNETVLLNGNSRLFTLDIDPNVDTQNFLAGLFIIESDLAGNEELVLKLSILFAIIGVTLMAVSIGLAIAAAAGAGISINPILITWISGVAFNVIGHYVPLIADDISFVANDTLSFVGKQDAGLVFERSLTIGNGFDIAGTFDGKYTAAGRWVTEA